MNPLELLAFSRELINWPDEKTQGLWPRAAALLGRQALESGLDGIWAQRAPGLEECSTHAQLLALHELLGDEELAEETSHTWWALTRATHHHAYELGPTVEELRNLLDSVERVVKA